MAKTRMINTKFWIDDYISNLSPQEKLLFLYFLTNPYTDICGIYEVPLKHISLETGISIKDVTKIIDKFSRDNKIYYANGWVAIKNFAKHQLDNPKVAKGIEIGLNKAPKEIKDRLSIDYQALSHLNSNSNINSNPNVKEKKSSKKEFLQGNQINELIELFKEVNPMYKDFFKNKTERQAIDDLAKQITYDKLKATIEQLPKIIGQPYAPKVTKPTELKRDLGKLIAFSKQKKSETIKKTTPNFII